MYYIIQVLVAVWCNTFVCCNLISFEGECHYLVNLSAFYFFLFADLKKNIYWLFSHLSFKSEYKSVWVCMCAISWLSPSNPRALITGSWEEVVGSPLHKSTHTHLLPRFHASRRNGSGDWEGEGAVFRYDSMFFFFHVVLCFFVKCEKSVHFDTAISHTLIFSFLPSLSISKLRRCVYIDF